MMSCSEAGKLFYEYLDKELTAVDVAKVEEHIKACEKCFGHMEFDKAFRAFLINQSGKVKLSENTKKIIQEKLRSLSE